MSLLKKHGRHFEVDQQKDIYDIIDGFEWHQLVTEAHLEKALKSLKDCKNGIKRLTDSEIGILFSGTGSQCPMLSAEQRNEYTNRLLKCFKMEGGISLGIDARNALLRVQIDNNINIDISTLLKQFETDGLVANSQTYGQLSRIYARKADIKGILEITNRMKSIGLELSDQILESMVYALVRSGQDDKAKSVIECSANNSFLSNSLKMSYALAKAENFDDGKVLEVLDGIVDTKSLVDNHLSSICNILFALANRGNHEAIVKLKEVFPLLLNSDIGKQWEFTVFSKTLRLLRKNEENIMAAALLLDFIPNFEKRVKLRTILTKQFPTIIQTKQVMEAVKTCIVFQKCNILKHPLRIYLREVAFNNANNFCQLFQIYKKTDDFSKLDGRSHLQIPTALFHLHELQKTDSQEKKVAHYLDIVCCLQSVDSESCGDNYFTIIKNLFVLPLLNDLNVLPQLMSKLETNSDLQSFLSDSIITHLLRSQQLKLLQELVYGALKNASAGRAYPYQELKNHILNASAYNKGLVPMCSSLRLLFPLSDAANKKQYRRGMQVIKSAIIAGELKKTKIMCELWSNDKRIALEENDKNDLLNTLDRNNEQPKKPFVALLSKKVKYLNDSVFSMESCCNAVLNKDEKKVDMEKVRTESEKHIGKELRRALEVDNLEEAWKIWISGSEYVPISLLLSFAEKLYFARMNDQFKSVLLKLKKIHKDFAYHVLTVYDSSDASVERMSFLSEMSKILDLHPEVKQQLVYNTRVSAFYKSIEKGSLSHAFELAKAITVQKNSVFGQFDLMGAAIDKDDTTVISEVLDLIRSHHGRESSLADFCVALLEHYKRDQALRLIQSGGFRLSGPKLSYYIDREIELNRVEIILDLFEFCSAEGKLELRDLESGVTKLINFYSKRKNIALVNLIEESSVLHSAGKQRSSVQQLKRTKVSWRHPKWKIDIIPSFVVKFQPAVRDAFNEITKGSHSFKESETQEAVKRFSDLRMKEHVLDYMVVKMASIVTVHLGWNEGKKVLEMSRTSCDLTSIFAGDASISDDHIEGAIGRIFSDIDDNAYEIARQFYCCLIDLKFCKVKNGALKIFIQHLLNK
ncbi:unnamed protein product [Thelazia callipaeda]|uniref:RAP domain-containing protein n=1 Tax=Thelazia callipaeda TaxID=103827 RepID=A0A0N5D3N0_THECL|nr:unnamed protein product [Thelazia callipaeda]